MEGIIDGRLVGKALGMVAPPLGVVGAEVIGARVGFADTVGAAVGADVTGDLDGVSNNLECASNNRRWPNDRSVRSNGGWILGSIVVLTVGPRVG